jgi:hypothetical protein
MANKAVNQQPTNALGKKNTILMQEWILGNKVIGCKLSLATYKMAYEDIGSCCGGRGRCTSQVPDSMCHFCLFLALRHVGSSS